MELKKLFIILWSFTISGPTLAQDRVFSYTRAAFAVNFFRNVSMPSSFVISPLSIDLALSVLVFGSSQQTYLELISGLQYPRNYSLNLIQNNFMLLNRNLRNAGGLEIATKLFITDQAVPQPNFRSVITRVLNSQVETVDFGNPDIAAATINSFVANATHNMIMEVIDPNELSDAVQMVLVNCVYFKGSWLYAFPRNQSFVGDFYVDDKNTVKVEYMNQKAKYGYGYYPELGGATAVLLPYKDSQMSMILLLPSEKTGLSEMLKLLANYDLSNIDRYIGMTTVNVTMPKFNITFDQHIDNPLKNMGMKTIFDPENANLNRMLNTAQKEVKLYVDTVIHKAIITVDEEGTVAAAVTAVVTRSIDMYFNAKRPFLYFLKCGKTIVFMGQFMGSSEPIMENTKKYEIGEWHTPAYSPKH